MKTLLIVVAFLFAGYVARAQDVKPGFKKVEKTGAKKNDIRKGNANPIPAIQISSTTPKNVSPYYWNDQVILEKLNVKTIPSDYPKHNKKLSKSENLNLIEKWMHNNTHLIKDKYKSLY